MSKLSKILEANKAIVAAVLPPIVSAVQQSGLPTKYGWIAGVLSGILVFVVKNANAPTQSSGNNPS